MAQHLIYEHVSAIVNPSTVTLSTKVALGPAILTEAVTIADTTSEQIFETPFEATFEANRRFACTLLLAATGEDATEYVQWLHISVATDGSGITVFDSQVLRTLLDSEIAEAVDFPFGVTLSNTTFDLEVTVENNAGQDVNLAAALQRESWVQPAAPA